MDAEPKSDELIGGPIPTIYDTLSVIRRKNVDEFCECEDTEGLSIKLGCRIYGGILVHSQNKGDVLYSGFGKFELGSDLVENLKFYYSKHSSSRQILTYSKANLDDAIREAGSIEWIREEGNKSKLKNLYR
jgi:hypothetical protein